jgi:hypothetical protein
VCDEIQAPLDRHGDTNEAAACPSMIIAATSASIASKC